MAPRLIRITIRFWQLRQLTCQCLPLSFRDVEDLLAERGIDVSYETVRRWFITKAERADQPPHIFEAVVGHKRQGMSLGRYSGGPSVEQQMRECVEAVRLPAGVELVP